MSELRITAVVTVLFFLAMCGGESQTESGSSEACVEAEFSVSDIGVKAKNI